MDGLTHEEGPTMGSFETNFDTTGDGVADTTVLHDEFDVDGDGVVDETRTSVTRRTDADGDGVNDTTQRWESHDADGDGNAETRSGETTKDHGDGTRTTRSSTSEDTDSDGDVDRRTTTTVIRGRDGEDRHEEIDEDGDGDVDVTRDQTVIFEPDGSFTVHITEDTDGDGVVDHEQWIHYGDSDGDGRVDPGSKWEWNRWDENNDGRWERETRTPGPAPHGVPDPADQPNVGEPYFPPGTTFGFVPSEPVIATETETAVVDEPEPVLVTEPVPTPEPVLVMEPVPTPETALEPVPAPEPVPFGNVSTAPSFDLEVPVELESSIAPVDTVLNPVSAIDVVPVDTTDIVVAVEPEPVEVFDAALAGDALAIQLDTPSLGLLEPGLAVEFMPIAELGAVDDSSFDLIG